MTPDVATRSAERSAPTAARDAIDSVTPRARVRIGGVVARVGVRPWAGGDVLECLLDDGTGQIVLAFLGRRSVPGIEGGRMLSAEGTVGQHRGRLLILNPFITLFAAD